MLLSLWSPKGGSGTSVVAAALGSVLARRSPVLLVDLAGDLAAVLGLPSLEPGRCQDRGWPGPAFPDLTSWLEAGAAAPSDALDALTHAVHDGLNLLAVAGPPHGAPPESGAALAAALAGHPLVVADAGRGDAPAQRALVEVAAASVLVVRECYLALRRAVADPLVARSAGVVVVAEPGRALRPREVSDVLGCPVLATIRVDPAVARAVDAGVLVHRHLGSLAGPIGSLAGAVTGWARGRAA